MGTRDPERRPRTLSSATSQVPPAPSSFSPTPFRITTVKIEQGAGSPVFAVPVPIGLQREKEACLGIREEGAAAVSLCWGEALALFYGREEGEMLSASSLREGFGGW